MASGPPNSTKTRRLRDASSTERSRRVLILRDEQPHRLALSIGDVPDTRLNLSRTPKPARAAVARPAFASRLTGRQMVQSAAGVCLDRVHHCLRRNGCADHRVDVIRPHVRRPELPPPMACHLEYRLKDDRALDLTEHEWRIAHALTLRLATIRVRRKQAAARSIVMAIHRTAFVSVQACAVTRECDEVRQAVDLMLFLRDRACHEVECMELGTSLGSRSERVTCLLRSLESHACSAPSKVPQAPLPHGRGSDRVKY